MDSELAFVLFVTNSSCRFTLATLQSNFCRQDAKSIKTAYEVARDPELYNLPALIDAADLAMETDPNNTAALEALLESKDAGERY